jgi:excisionase family DNA binding protein
MEDAAALEPMQPPARQRLDRNSVSPRRPNTKTKHSILAPKRPPATASSADMISASTNLIALVEKRSGAWSAPELAELLGCTGKHIYALAKSGRLPHLRIGSMIRFDPAATAEWLRNRFIAA